MTSTVDTRLPKGQGQNDNRRKRQSLSETKLSFEFYLSEGNTYRNSGDLSRAITGYTKALDIKPDHKECRLFRSQCYLRLGDTQSAIVDVNATLEDDPKFIKGVLQKADIYYQMGEFEQALVLYHRGRKLRPDIEAFRLGIQLCQEAVENSIGERAKIKLKKTGDLSFFAELQQSGKEQGDRRVTRQMNTTQQTTSKKATAAGAAAAAGGGGVGDNRRVKQLLEQLYVDKEFLEKILKNAEEAHSRSNQNEAVVQLTSGCLEYLDRRATFWQQKKPTYARRKNKTIEKKKIMTSDIMSWVLENITQLDQYYSDGDYEGCLKKAHEILQQLDKCSDKNRFPNVEFRCTVNSYAGNASVEMRNYKKALEYHQQDYDLAKQHQLSEALIRSVDNIGRTRVKQGKWNDAIKIFEERQPLTSQALERSWLYHEIGRCHQQLGRYNESLDHGQRAYEAAVECDDKVWQLNTLLLIAESHRCLKQWSKAVEKFEQAAQLAKSVNDFDAFDAIQRNIDDVNNRRTENDLYEQDDDVDLSVHDDKKSPAKPMADHEEDERLRRKSESEMTTYSINVKISDVDDAGSKSPLFIELLGTGAASRRITLDRNDSNPQNTLERASDNEFEFRTIDLGEVNVVRIGLVNKQSDSGPHIAHVKITDRRSNRTYMFACHQWLDKDRGDKKTERELLPIAKKSDKGSLTHYHVSVRTGDEADAGTDAKVFLQVFGERGETEPILLDTTHSGSNIFERAQTKEFDFDEVDVGQVRKVRVSHTGSSWLLNDINIHVSGKEYNFKYCQWFGQNSAKTDIELLPI